MEELLSRKPTHYLRNEHQEASGSGKKQEILRNGERELLEQMNFALSVVHGTDRRRRRTN